MRLVTLFLKKGRNPFPTILSALFHVSISSTFTNVVLAAFSSYVLALAKNSYKKRSSKTLMKLTACRQSSPLRKYFYKSSFVQFFDIIFEYFFICDSFFIYVLEKNWNHSLPNNERNLYSLLKVRKKKMEILKKMYSSFLIIFN